VNDFRADDFDQRVKLPESKMDALITVLFRNLGMDSLRTFDKHNGMTLSVAPESYLRIAAICGSCSRPRMNFNAISSRPGKSASVITSLMR
jgi:hypothetical protein